MRLISAEVHGWGRLVDAKINLDSKLIAIVGPNESGKTTLLHALAFIDREDATLEPAKRSRAVTISDSDVVTQLVYALDDEDESAYDAFDLVEPPTHLRIRKTAGGDQIETVEPEPRKSREHLRSKVEVLKKVGPTHARNWIDFQNDNSVDQTDDVLDPAEELKILTKELDGLLNQGRSVSTAAPNRARKLLNATDPDAPDSFRNSLKFVLEWLETPAPGPEIASRLWKTSPDLILFDETDRSLLSSYDLNESVVHDPPGALANLTAAAGLDLEELFKFDQDGDIARRESLVLRANSRLETLFSVWKQSQLTVRLSIDGGRILITMLDDDKQVTIFDERSAGLRMFVALITFLHIQCSDQPKILLIDEVESHLHIDAQADLISMFASQDQAEKVIYTTHSPACLPPDLGTGIRAIVAAGDPQTSAIQNNFWGGRSAGFSPLMLALGASAAAFTPARFAVIAEGASDMILLPSLIRAATGIDELAYQISSGLSEAPKDLLSDLDLEAARVAYLVDGDDGGDRLADDLARAGTPQKLVIKLTVPGVENLLDPDQYTQALATLLGESEGNSPALTDICAVEQSLAAHPETASWAKSCENLIHAAGLRPPSRVAVANWLVQNQAAKPSEFGQIELRRIHDLITEALCIPETNREST